VDLAHFQVCEVEERLDLQAILVAGAILFSLHPERVPQLARVEYAKDRVGVSDVYREQHPPQYQE
jgi:hypothetical protein